MLRLTTGRFWWPFRTAVGFAAGVLLVARALGTGDVALLGTRNGTTVGIFLAFLLYGGARRGRRGGGRASRRGRRPAGTMGGRPGSRDPSGGGRVLRGGRAYRLAAVELNGTG